MTDEDGFEDPVATRARTQPAIEADLKERAKTTIINLDICDQVASKHGVTSRNVKARAVQMGLPFDFSREVDIEDEDHDNEDQDNLTSITQIVVPNQYGVLQGPANLVGGFATTLGWIILFVCIAGLVALVTGYIGQDDHNFSGKTIDAAS